MTKTMRERWEEIRDEVTLPLEQPNKTVAETWLDGLNTACKRIAELEAERRWVPVEERLPEDGARVLGLFRHNKIHVLSRQSSEWCGAHSEPLVLIEPTHWMPIPPPPEATDAD